MSVFDVAKQRHAVVTVSKFYPLPEQEAEIFDALVSRTPIETPWGERVVMSLTATTGPDGYSFVLAVPDE